MSREIIDAQNKTIERLINALDQIQHMALEDLRDWTAGANTARIEDTARVAIAREQ